MPPANWWPSTRTCFKPCALQFAKGYAARLDVATQESQLAQVAAMLPPLLKQLAQQRDLLAALAGSFPSQAQPSSSSSPACNCHRIAREPSLATRRPASGRAPGRGEPSRRQCPGWHRGRQPPAEYYADGRCRDHGVGGRQDVFERHRLLDFGGRRDPTHFPRRSFVAQGTGRPGSLYAGRRTIPGHGPDRLPKCRRHIACAPTGC